jgi:hypothetical protein
MIKPRDEPVASLPCRGDRKEAKDRAHHKPRIVIYRFLFLGHSGNEDVYACVFVVRTDWYERHVIGSCLQNTHRFANQLIGDSFARIVNRLRKATSHGNSAAGGGRRR